MLHSWSKRDSTPSSSAARPARKGSAPPRTLRGGPHIHIGIDWLESLAFKHIDRIGERVLIIGVGNTAMDCCRSARRLGGRDIKVMARRPRGFFKASPWELEDAEEEGIEILVNHAPKRFVLEHGKLIGMEFERLEWDTDATHSKTVDSVILPCDDVILAIGQEAAFTWIERDIGIEFGEQDLPIMNETTFMSTRPGVFFGGDAPGARRTHLGGRPRTCSRYLHSSVCARPAGGLPAAPRSESNESEVGISEWSYSNDFNPVLRQKMKHVDLASAFGNCPSRWSSASRPSRRPASGALSELRRTDCLCRSALHECDACVDVCPVLCLTIAPNGEEKDMKNRLTAPALDPDQALFVSEELPQTKRVMLKMRTSVCTADSAPSVVPPPPGTCKYRISSCPTMGKVMSEANSRVNDFAFKLANVNGTGSASANGLLMQAIFRMGIPVSARTSFIQHTGAPHWYEIRVNKDGRTSRRGV